MPYRKMLARKIEVAFCESDWLTLCAAARILITLQDGPRMKPLPCGMAFRWRGSRP